MSWKQRGLLLILCFFLSAGCSNSRKFPVNEKVRRLVTPISRDYKNKLLQDTQFAGKIKKEKVEVLYQAGLQDQANHIAELTYRAFSHIEKSTGFQTACDSFTVYLILTNKSLLDISPIVSISADDLGVILIVKSIDDSNESIVSSNSNFPFNFVHEIVEGSLLFPKEGTRIEFDHERKAFGFINLKILNSTRWFREGFATYCGYLAHEAIISEKNFEENKVSHALLLNGSHLHPFSALSKIGKGLFFWNQYSRFSPETSVPPNLPNPRKGIVDYYDASFGLFLLIRDKFGEDSIRKIIRGINTLEYADGPALIKLINTILDTDIKQMVKNFHFPQTGLYMEPLYFASFGEPKLKELSVFEGLYVTVVEPGSPAEKAGIRKNDVIYRINDRDTKANIDFELAIYQFMGHQSVTVHILRDQEQEVTAELTLATDAAREFSPHNMLY